MIDKIEWKDKYKIGVSKIDAQHKQLFKYLEELRLSLPLGLNNPTVGTTLKRIVEYTQTHFKDEELFMKSIKFNDLEKHANLHRELIQKVISILNKLKKGEDFNALDLLNFLKHWVTDHMLQEDFKIGIAYKEAIIKQKV